MRYHCPECRAAVHMEEEGEPQLVRCPECGADLYPEEIEFLQMITECGAHAA